MKQLASFMNPSLLSWKIISWLSDQVFNAIKSPYFQGLWYFYLSSSVPASRYFHPALPMFFLSTCRLLSLLPMDPAVVAELGIIGASWRPGSEDTWHVGSRVSSQANPRHWFKREFNHKQQVYIGRGGIIFTLQIDVPCIHSRTWPLITYSRHK